MSSEEQDRQGDGAGIKTPITRRDFLKTAGVTGIALGATGGLGGVLAACGSSSDDTSGGGGGDGRTIKVGFVSPLTGPLAAFGETDQWLVEQWKKAAVRTASSAATARPIPSRSSSRTRSRTRTARRPSPATSSPTTASTS